VAEALGGWSRIDRVSYPGVRPGRQAELADGLLRPGRSGLITFSLKEKGLEPLRWFYDAIRPPVLKGPGLGGETSLICPYVMLAHYRDSDAFLEAQGLDRHSLRLSVGVEPVDDILESLGIGI
jgi:cystathionine gamma-synthase